MGAIQYELIDKSINNGVDYLHQHQFPNGEFCLYIGHEDKMHNTIPYSNVFSTSLICYSLLLLKDAPKVKEILDLSSSFLQFQCMRAGVWNNFTTWSPLFKVCPADVDNTSCASVVLKSLKKDYTQNEEILYANRNKSGLFYTWYTYRPNKIWNKNYWLLILREYKNPLKSIIFWNKFECTRTDVDAAVNANVLFYLGLNENTKPIIPYLLNIIKRNEESNCDQWYRNPFTIYYFISRNYKKGIHELEPARDIIIERILMSVKENGSIGESILDTALAVISLLNFDYFSDFIVNPAIQYLRQNQTPYGNWPRQALFYGGAKKLSCFGSEELTTGFCIEALILYKLIPDNEGD